METSFICFVSRLDMFWIYLKFDICSVASKAAQPIVLIFQISKKFQKFEFKNLCVEIQLLFCNTISFFVTQLIFFIIIAFFNTISLPARTWSRCRCHWCTMERRWRSLSRYLQIRINVSILDTNTKKSRCCLLYTNMHKYINPITFATRCRSNQWRCTASF